MIDLHQVAAETSDEEVLEAEKALALNDLYYFAHEVLRIGEGSTFVRPANEIEPITRWLQKPRPERVGPTARWKRFVALPRGTAKTTLVQCYAAWRILRDPDVAIFYTSEEKALSLDAIAHIGEYLASERVTSLYGMSLKGDRDWQRGKFTVTARRRPRKEPTMMAGGVDVSSQGRHYDLIIADDLQGQTNNTPEGIGKVKEYLSLLWPILNPGGELIWICTRWDYDDAAADILKQWTQDRSTWDAMGVSRGFFGAYAVPGDDEFFSHAVVGEPLFPSILPEDELQKLKHEAMTLYTFSCCPGFAPVLISDWTEKPIEEVAVGESVIGFQVNGTPRDRRTLVHSRVIAKGLRQAKVVKIQLSDGNEIYCTPDHQWFTGRAEPGRHAYAPAQVPWVRHRPVVGTSRLLKVIETGAPPGDPTDWAYLAGMIDGEGAVRHGALQIVQSETHNRAVCRRLVDTLNRLGLDFSIWADPRGNANVYSIGGGRTVKRWLLEARPGKALDIVQAMWASPGRPFVDRPRVVSIEGAGEMLVYSLQTATGNYVVWGYGSKNCQFLNDPIPSEAAYFGLGDFQYVPPYDPTNDTFQGLQLYMGVDTASGDATIKRGDDTAIVIVGVRGERSKRAYFVLDVAGGQWKPDRIMKTIVTMYERWRPRRVGIESTGPGKVFYETFKQWLQGEMTYLPLREVSHSGTQESKAERIASLEPQYRSHAVFHCENVRGSKLEEQLLRFKPGSRIHDDYPDALATAIECVREGHMRQPVPQRAKPRYASTGY